MKRVLRGSFFGGIYGTGLCQIIEKIIMCGLMNFEIAESSYMQGEL
jgi:hypothetical protein